MPMRARNKWLCRAFIVGELETIVLCEPGPDLDVEFELEGFASVP
jgi:hypothetical protein